MIVVTCGQVKRVCYSAPPGYTPAMARAVIIPRVSPYVARLERLRRQIPLERYIQLLDAAGSTGFLPQLDPSGRPTGKYDPVKVPERIAIITALLNKGMPARQETPSLPEDMEAQRQVIDVSKLDDKELEDILASDAAAPVEVIDAPLAQLPSPNSANGHNDPRPSPPGTDEETGERGAEAPPVD